MRIESTSNGFITWIENAVVEKVICDFEGICTIHYYRQPTRTIEIHLTPYERQFGTPISEDGSLLFTSSWEKGLFAYDTSSGNIRWHFKSTKITAMFLYSTYLVVNKSNSALLKIDINNGELLEQIKSGTIQHSFALNNAFVLVDSIKGKLCVIDTRTMEITMQYSKRVTNPSNCLSFLIQGANWRNGVLSIWGVEEYPEYNNELKGKRTFNRVVDSQLIL